MRAHRSPIWKLADQEFTDLVAEKTSYGDILKHFGFVNKGANYKTVQARIAHLGLSTAHFRKCYAIMAASKKHSAVALSSVLVTRSSYNRGHLKKRLIREGMIKNMCALCRRPPKWLGAPLVLILDHINGESTDNRLENLRLLCPNCNSQQPTFAGRNRPAAKHVCKDCGGKVCRQNASGLCKRCVPRKRKVGIRPSISELMASVRELGWEATGRQYGVSGNAVKKWVKTL